MTSVIPLGTFAKVALRDAWPSESGNFTPWLAIPQNLALLADTLDLGELQDQQTEVAVGRFFIDILARDSEGETVLIENQFGPTNHGHLGQILTYLAGQEGNATIVWIAEKFHEEHRAAIDWLNTSTGENYSFFAVEIELWKIDSSPPAPRFNVVAKGNKWTKGVRVATAGSSSPELAERHRIRLAYWTSFADYLHARHSTFSIIRPSKTIVHRFPIGQSGFRIVAMIVIRSQRAIVGLSTPRSPDKSTFQALLAQRTAIDADFGEPLDWQEKPGRERSLISVSREGVDPADQSQYHDLHAWMLTRMDRMQAVFAPRIRALPPSIATEIQDDEEVEEAEE